mgnify:CR=1 FL=1
MIQNTDNKPLSELFSGDNNVTYYIPKYQREYVWSKWNWEALFDDILESEGGHFLGSIICINTETDSHKPANLELVDGQQRMTTISLLYLAIYKFLQNTLVPTEDEEKELDNKLKLFSLRNRIIIKDKKKPRLSPSYSNHNFEDYSWIFADNISEIKHFKKPKNLGNRRIKKTFNYFYDRLSEVDENDEPLYDFKSALVFLNKLNSATIVKIDVATHADAFTLFETLNNRGVPLSAIDIIKNKLLGHLEKFEDETSLDANYNRWNDIIQNLTEEYKVQERFLRQFYNAFKLEKVIEVPKIPKALRSNLITIYESLINKNVHIIFDRLEEASEIYNKNIVYNSDEHSFELIRALRDLENVNGADGYMLLLHVEKNYKISEKEKIQLIKLLCKYFIRRNVTDTPPTRDLTNHFMDILKEVNNLDEYDYEKIESIILDKGKPATDEFFEEKLKGNIYEENVGATRYILSSIELDKKETKELYTNFYARDKKKFVWTIEHIFPQGENIPEHWIKMVADGDKTEADQIRRNQVHKLGNLTLTGYNSRLSNSPLDIKQNKKNKEGKYIGFKNGLWINEAIKDIDTWKEKNIKNRTDKLVSEALRIFRLKEVSEKSQKKVDVKLSSFDK